VKEWNGGRASRALRSSRCDRSNEMDVRWEERSEVGRGEQEIGTNAAILAQKPIGGRRQGGERLTRAR